MLSGARTLLPAVLPLLELQLSEELGGGGPALDVAEVDVAQREARQGLHVAERERQRSGVGLL